MNKKLLIGLGIAAVATTLVAIGVIHELRQIRSLTVDADELPNGLKSGEDEVEE